MFQFHPSSRTRPRKLAQALFAVLVLPAIFATAARADDAAAGRVSYLRYCAACHGRSADGNGPAAKALKDQPTDLRKLGQSYGMPLPAARIARFIDGRDVVLAHGTRTMPVWGERFAEIYAAHRSPQGDMNAQIKKIIVYLNSIQEPARALPPPAIH